jgi:glycerophosphoryl diester phosphodiesterase
MGKVRGKTTSCLLCALTAWLCSGPTGCCRGADEMELTPAARLVASRNVLVIAHRGASGRAPENTIPAFQAALEDGAHLVELDYFHSADGVPIVFHDKDLDRCTDAVARLGREKTPVGALTLAELKKLDAGSWFDARFAGTRIPTLAEAIDAIQAGSTTLIEHKTGDAATCIELLRKNECLGSVIVQSFDWDYLRDCRRLAPRLTVVALGDKELTDELLDSAVALGAAGVGWKEDLIGQAQIEAIHRRGLKAWVYTVNDGRRAKELAAAGIDGIITNEPGEMGKLLRP